MQQTDLLVDHTVMRNLVETTLVVLVPVAGC